MSLAVLAAVALSAQDPKIDDYVQSNFRSATFTAAVGSATQTELQKINKDFAQSYRFKSMDVWMKEPFKIRMESKVDDSDILMVINGPVRKLSVPKARLSQRFDLSKEPGKRQTALDFGILTPALFEGFFQAKFVRTERRTEELVFDLTYAPPLNKDKSRHRVWIDPAKKMMTKRQWYANKGGYLMATFDYKDPVNVAGVWMPTTISVTNADNKLAGTTNYRNLKVNTSIDDTKFAVN